MRVAVVHATFIIQFDFVDVTNSVPDIHDRWSVSAVTQADVVAQLVQRHCELGRVVRVLRNYILVDPRKRFGTPTEVQTPPRCVPVGTIRPQFLRTDAVAVLRSVMPELNRSVGIIPIIHSISERRPIGIARQVSRVILPLWSQQRVVGMTLHSAPPTGYQNDCNSTVSLHVAMSTLAYLATVLEHLQDDDCAHRRHMRIKLPPAKRPRAGPGAEQNVDPGIVAALVIHELNSVQQAA